ncbi:hypothetical protein RRG08_062445 [Elysia crispata]|nr:hypothetical protein RRG08_062445 [Elysia crispata]
MKKVLQTFKFHSKSIDNYYYFLETLTTLSLELVMKLKIRRRSIRYSDECGRFRHRITQLGVGSDPICPALTLHWTISMRSKELSLVNDPKVSLRV